MLNKAKILKVAEERMNKEIEQNKGKLDGIKFPNNNDLVFGSSLIALRVLIEVAVDEIDNALDQLRNDLGYKRDI